MRTPHQSVDRLGSRLEQAAGPPASGSLPLTGGPVGATVAVGAVLVAGGAGALWYTRRRRAA